ncbi:MAG: 30S ribosomal protein S12 methylthiotransferase RimO [Bacteroidales bacterium]|nr:30S ribosomal protein S12 methylthiotransferase RimO [Bacteroidales bacterium]
MAKAKLNNKDKGGNVSSAEVDVITLGCSKNLVDSERLMHQFADSGIAARHNPDENAGVSPVIVINTCGFIGDAKEESINTILQYAALKSDGQVKKIIVMGCLSERYREVLPAELPEVDAWYGKFDWVNVVSDLSRERAAEADYQRVLSTPPHSAYLKIAEGCNRFCAFCAIPLITGRFKSRPIEEIVEEVKSLTDKGVTELNVIAQDLSSYGLDIYGKKSLAELITAISEVEKVKWIRLHYAYPADFPYDILPVMRDNPKVCKYLDIALQHISDRVLTNMRRHISAAETRALIRRIREEVPGIHLRTTLMVGFPGEEDADFEELKQFVADVRFERMGAFAYCEEDDTYAAKHLPDVIEDSVKQQRLDEIMQMQEEISFEIQQDKVGKTFEVVVDREDDDYYVARTQFDSPEVDPEVLIRKDVKLTPGQYYSVKVVEALPFELIAEVCQ